jgi:hypothetical protein
MRCGVGTRLGRSDRAADNIVRADRASVRDAAARRRLFAVRDKSFDVAGVAAYRFDVALRGENETLFFLD